MLIVLPCFPAAGEDFVIELTSQLVSAPYVDITLEMLEQFGITVEVDKAGGQGFGSFRIPAGQAYRPLDFTVPGDFSGIAFPVAAAATVEGPVDVTINNLDFNSAQGDKAIVDILQGAGAAIEKNYANRSLHISGGRGEFPLQAINVDMEEIPDCFPILSVVSAFGNGVSRLYNAAHVRLKETDRIAVMHRELNKMGVEMQEEPTAAEITGASELAGATFITDKDHRIAMSMTVAALSATSESTIKGAEVVKDSYPGFWDDMKALGVKTR
jgi:3-phosphoshikimate 1-carboxyvinyltransferase